MTRVDFSEGDNPEVTGLQMGTPDGDIHVEADAYLAACDVPGIQKLLPEAWNVFRSSRPFTSWKLCRWPRFSSVTTAG